MAKKATVLFFGERVFFFYPHKIEEGYLNIFDARNHCVGRTKVVKSTEIADQVEDWLIQQNLVGGSR